MKNWLYDFYWEKCWTKSQCLWWIMSGAMSVLYFNDKLHDAFWAWVIMGLVCNNVRNALEEMKKKK